jgi:hypothetical protein
VGKAVSTVAVGAGTVASAAPAQAIKQTEPSKSKTNNFPSRCVITFSLNHKTRLDQFILAKSFSRLQIGPISGEATLS